MADFDSPQEPKDDLTKQLYVKLGLGEAPTMAQIQPLAIERLGNVLTAMEGAQLVLGRVISSDSEEDKLIRQIANASSGLLIPKKHSQCCSSRAA